MKAQVLRLLHYAAVVYMMKRKNVKIWTRLKNVFETKMHKLEKLK